MKSKAQLYYEARVKVWELSHTKSTKSPFLPWELQTPSLKHQWDLFSNSIVGADEYQQNVTVLANHAKEYPSVWPKTSPIRVINKRKDNVICSQNSQL